MKIPPRHVRNEFFTTAETLTLTLFMCSDVPHAVSTDCSFAAFMFLTSAKEFWVLFWYFISYSLCTRLCSNNSNVYRVAWWTTSPLTQVCHYYLLLVWSPDAPQWTYVYWLYPYNSHQRQVPIPRRNYRGSVRAGPFTWRKPLLTWKAPTFSRTGQWTGRLPGIFYSASVIWGLVGP